jgi:Domain of unknown function (DUF4224)
MDGRTFLDHDEIVRLTGRKQPARQVAYLRERGYLFDINAAGYPLVLRSAVEARLMDKPPRRPRLELLERPSGRNLGRTRPGKT